MTEPTTGKVAQLTPEEWKQLVLLNAAQLSNFLQSIPGNVEGGTSGLTDAHLAQIDVHMARGRGFMRAWGLSKLPMAAPQEPAVTDTAAKSNGTAPATTKRRGGWPAGKPRTRQAKPSAVTQ